MNIKEHMRMYSMVLQISRKPGKEEFLTSTKICALGIALIGFIGFVIFLLFTFLLPGA
ncbi:MAG: protein translocase SEC61 complex subunit gamma [Candidatus Aenigmarchaeota archaeon]|nr:protein translocase SEC61 complex subunit gamma [Candidatus Aenigmarchaeota archaeon]